MSREANAVSIVAENIKRLRSERLWSQEELADRCGLHRTYVGAIERGERNLTVRTLFKIAEALECDPQHLLKAEHGD